MSYAPPAQIQALAGAGGLTRYTFNYNYLTRIGPIYSSGVGPPAGTPPVGSVYRDTATNNLYYATSGGWQSPFTIVVAPIIDWAEGLTNPPSSGTGTTGDYIVDVTNLVLYGPKTGPADEWTGTALHPWNLLAPVGAPTALDGVEGDWAWIADPDPLNGRILIYGPKGATEWPPWYATIMCTNPPTTVAFHMAADADANNPRISPGMGAGGTSNFGSNFETGGYTRLTRISLPTEPTTAANQLVVGAEMVTSAFTTTGIQPQGKVLVDGAELSGTLNTSVTARSSFNAMTDANTVPLQVHLKSSGFIDHFGQCTTLTGSVTVFTLG